MTRQQRRYEARKGRRTVGFTYVPSFREHPKYRAPGNGGKRSWEQKPSCSDNPAYRQSIWPAVKVERRSAA